MTMCRPVWLAALFAATLMAAGCSREIETEPPPRVETTPDLSRQVSTMTVPVAVSLDQLQAALETAAPRQLWRMNERKANCIPSQSVRPLGIDIELTPDVPCTIIGEVDRGRIRLSGSGNRLTIRLPTNATIRAEDIGGILAGETATGAADVAINARLSITPDWRLAADLDLDYSWSRQPGIDFLGQRIEFTRRADSALTGIVADLERELEREVGRIALRPMVERAWQSGFTTVSLNAENPPAWLRITPQQVGIAGYRVEGRQLLVDIALTAHMETRIGERPEPAAPTPLPPQSATNASEGIMVQVPVMTDYDQLEAVAMRELGKLAQNGVQLPGIGTVDAQFHEVEIYATENGRIAVGVKATVTPREGISSRYGSAEGQVWLTGRPYNAENSPVLSIRELAMEGDTDRRTVDLLIALFADEQARAAIEAALVGDFSKDYDRILEDAREAVADIESEGLSLSITIDEVRHGRVQATGAGLFLPVQITGEGRLDIDIEQDLP